MDKFEIRWARDEDRPAIISCIRDVFKGEEEFAMMAEFFTGPLHAYAKPETTCIAVDKENGAVAAVEITAPIAWAYEGIPLKAQVLLLTGTHPDYRGMKVMPLIHGFLGEYFVENGYDLSFVDGIPWFYRRFGYLPMELNGDKTDYDRHTMPNGKKTVENYVFKPFTESDIPFALELLRQKAEGKLFSFIHDERWLRMMTLDYFEENSDLSTVICGADGEALGVLLNYTKDCAASKGKISAAAYALKKGVSHFAVTPAVTEFMAREGDRQMGADGGCTVINLPYDGFVSEVMADCMSRTHYANKTQCRLTDAAAFIRKIAPVIEKRIAESPICGYTKKVGVQLFGHDRDLWIDIADGLIKDVYWENADFVNKPRGIQMPYDTFMRLLFGVEDVDGLRNRHREVNSGNGDRLNNEMRLLLKTIFPMKRSYIMYSC